MIVFLDDWNFKFDGNELKDIYGSTPFYSSTNGVFTNSKPTFCPLTYRCEKVINPPDPATTSCDYSDATTEFIFDTVSGQLTFKSTDEYNDRYGWGEHHLKIYAKGGTDPDGQEKFIDVIFTLRCFISKE